MGNKRGKNASSQIRQVNALKCRPIAKMKQINSPNQRKVRTFLSGIFCFLLLHLLGSILSLLNFCYS